MSRLLKSAAAKKALAKVQRIAKRLEQEWNDKKSIEEQADVLRDILDQELARDEYFVIVDETGYGHIHTNRLREGITFTDEVGQKSAKTESPLLQLYQRDSGELLVDASCPVIRRNQKRYNLRMGRLIHKPFFH